MSDGTRPVCECQHGTRFIVFACVLACQAHHLSWQSSVICSFCIPQISKEFPELLGIKESLIEYVFKPNAEKKDEVHLQALLTATSCDENAVSVPSGFDHSRLLALDHSSLCSC